MHYNVDSPEDCYPVKPPVPPGTDCIDGEEEEIDESICGKMGIKSPDFLYV